MHSNFILITPQTLPIHHQVRTRKKDSSISLHTYRIQMNSSNTQYPHSMLYTPASPTSRVQVLARTQPSEARSTPSLVGWVGGAPVSVPAGLLWGCTPRWELGGARGAEVQGWNELNLTGQILEGWSLRASAVGPVWRPAVEVVSVWSLNHGEW